MDLFAHFFFYFCLYAFISFFQSTLKIGNLKRLSGVLFRIEIMSDEFGHDLILLFEQFMLSKDLDISCLEFGIFALEKFVLFQLLFEKCR